MPPLLEAAIRETASLSETEPESQGGGKGWLVQRNLSGSLLAHNDQTIITALVLASDATNAEVTCDISPTLLAHAAKGCPIVVMDE